MKTVDRSQNFVHTFKIRSRLDISSGLHIGCLIKVRGTGGGKVYVSLTKSTSVSSAESTSILDPEPFATCSSSSSGSGFGFVSGEGDLFLEKTTTKH